MPSDEAEKVLLALDSQQRQAARELLGPVAVLAGAGSGKTRTITHRIAYGVKSGVYDPERVLALTYTKKAAAEMKQRLAELAISGVKTKTFHSVALEQLQRIWPNTIGGRTPELIMNTRHITAEAALNSGVNLSELEISALDAEIKWRKTMMLGYSGYQASGRAEKMLPTVSVKQAIEIMGVYEDIKMSRKQLDSEDVLALVAAMIESNEYVAKILRSAYDFYTVDEYQDISPLQHKLLTEWLGSGRNLCVVGDVSQTIFSFAGASKDFLLGFESYYPAAKRFKLTSNYRSSAAIVKHANALISESPGSLQLQSKTDTAAIPVQCARFANSELEAATIAAFIAAQIKTGESPSKIAVLARNARQLKVIANALRGAGIPVKEQHQLGFFSRSDVKKVIVELYAAARSGTENTPAFQIVSDILRSHGWSSQRPQTVSEIENWIFLDTLNSLIYDLLRQHSLPAAVTILQDMAKRSEEPEIAAVTLCSVHSSKGLEWDHVYLAAMVEGVLPARQSLNSEDAIAEEKRIAYVAFTRARKILRISCAKQDGGRSLTPSRFISEAKIPIIEVD